MAKKKSPSVLAREKLATDKRLKKNYARLKKAGFSSYDASSMRYGSKEKIRTAIKTKTRPEISTKAQKSGGGSGTRYRNLDTYQPAAPLETHHVGRIKNSDYTVISNKSSVKYLNEYSYKMTYLTVDKYGVETRKFFTYGDSKQMNKGELKEFVWNRLNIPSLDTEYEAKPVKSSIEFVSAYFASDTTRKFNALTYADQEKIINSPGGFKVINYNNFGKIFG